MQVGRLSRQAGEEGAERRRAEEQCQLLDQRVRQLEEDLVKATEECERITAERDELRAKSDELTKRLDQLDAELVSHLFLLPSISAILDHLSARMIYRQLVGSGCPVIGEQPTIFVTSEMPIFHVKILRKPLKMNETN